MKKRKSYIFLFWLIPIMFGFFIYQKSGFYWEIEVLNWATHTPNVILDFFKKITFLGNIKTTILLWIPLGVLVYRKDRDLFFGLILVFILAVLHIVIFKNLFQRVRPEEFKLIQQGGFSYPSGHSVTSIAVYFTIAKFMKEKVIKISLIILPLLIGISRIFVGVHWPTDVLMGFSLGYFIFQIATMFIFQRKLNLGDFK